jgi:hypothetical protein
MRSTPLFCFYKITKPGVNIPSGSSNQEDWSKKRYTRVPYTEAASCDSVLRVAFRDTTEKQPVRHVWFVVNGCTIESTTRAAIMAPPRCPGSIASLRRATASGWGACCGEGRIQLDSRDPVRRSGTLIDHMARVR